MAPVPDHKEHHRMNPRPIRPDDLRYWSAHNPQSATISGPDEVEADIAPCPALLTTDPAWPLDTPVVRVPWQLDEIELACLVMGGTLWLTTFGGLPIHSMEVQAPGQELRP